jgi:hypothetical protein
LNFENDLERKNHQPKSCRYWRVMRLCHWQCFGLKLSCHAKLCLNFKIWIFQTISDGKTTKIKVVGLELQWNFVIDNFLIWNHLIIEKFVWSFQIWNSNFVNGLVCRNYQNKTCRSRKVMQLYSWSHFQID